MLGDKYGRKIRSTIIHSLPGRVRIRCTCLKNLNEDVFLKELKKEPSIKKITLNTITGTVLILYESEKVNLNFVKRYFDELIGKQKLLEINNSILINKECYQCREKEDSVTKILKNIGIVTGTLLYTAVRKNNTNTLVTGIGVNRFLTVPSVVSLALTAPVLKNGVVSLIKDKRPNEDTLTSTAILSSLLLGKDVSALLIILLSNTAELLTEYTVQKTRKSIKDMLSLNDEYAWKCLSDGSIKKIKICDISKDDIVAIHTGEKVCVDGRVVSGECAVDQSPITGEYMPVVKNIGDKVFAGSIVKSGTITVITEKSGDSTVVARILHMVDNAISQRAPMQNYADKFSNFLLPFSFLFAGVTYLVTKSPTRALNMLIIDFCCGMKLSTATAFSAAINNAVKNGILIKGGNYIEAMADSDTVVFDKTGTLTEGKPEVTSIVSLSTEFTEKEIIEIASAAEETSNHPLALGILSKLKAEGWVIPHHGETKMCISRGTVTTIGDDTVRVGSKTFMDELNIDTSSVKEKEEYLMKNGEKIIYVALNDELIGLIGIQDKMRDNMKKAINSLRYRGIHDIILLTGDLEEHAESTAYKMGVDSYQAELLPMDKVKAVQKLQSKGSKVIMIGDGVNDAPALAHADVGISIGSKSTDIAIEASDITIQREDPMLIPDVMNLSQNTMKIVKQNFTLVFTINSIGLLLSAFGALPVIWGAVLHNSSTILVVGNSIRLLLFKPKGGKINEYKLS